MSDCPCGSGRDLATCCGPYLSGEKPAPTAETLMRSRYSAYVEGEIEYLNESLHPNHRADHDLSAARRWSQEADWEGLEIRSTENGGENDEEGTVEFVVKFRDKGVHRLHHEIGRFKQLDGRWYYVDGEFVPPQTQQHEGRKVGRNEPCPCGSGKKFKKCCGR